MSVDPLAVVSTLLAGPVCVHFQRADWTTSGPQCPEIVRKPSAYWTTSGRFPDIGGGGRFPDIEVRKSSAWASGSGHKPDLPRGSTTVLEGGTCLIRKCGPAPDLEVYNHRHT